MNINLHFHVANLNVSTVDEKLLKALSAKVDSLNSKLDIMGANTDKALADLQEINTKLTKISTESSTLLQKVTDLENAAANADTPQSVLDAIAAVKAQAQAVDDLVPDAPPSDNGEGNGETTTGNTP